MQQSARSIAFFVYPVLRFPRNNRQYYLTKELLSRGWHVIWLVPKSGKNEGVPVDDHILHYDDLNIRGRTYLLPLYLGFLLRAKGIKFFWLSGWAITSGKEIYWLIRIMRMFGIETVYDPIDPICEFKVANRELTDSGEITKCHRKMNLIYALCTKVLCVTPEMKSLLVSNGADESRLFVARWGTDATVFSRNRIKGDFRERLNIADSEVLVGWLGSMTEFKGLKEIFFPVMERVMKNPKVHFIIAGDGPLYNEIEAWVKSLNKPAVTLLGRIDYADAAEFTAALDAYLVTTNPDSEYARAICPVKCYDALAVGTLLVTTRTPATEYLVDFSGNVLLCNYDIDAFENAVRHVTANIDVIRKSGSGNVTGFATIQSVSKEIADMLDGIEVS